jgi:hypothetical protein
MRLVLILRQSPPAGLYSGQCADSMLFGLSVLAGYEVLRNYATGNAELAAT